MTIRGRMTNEQTKNLSRGDILVPHPGEKFRIFQQGGVRFSFEYIYEEGRIPFGSPDPSRLDDLVIAVLVLNGSKIEVPSPFFCSRFLPFIPYSSLDKILEIWG